MKIETFDTSDLYTAAFLLTKGLKLVRHERDGKRITFHFTPSQKAETLAHNYLFGDDTVPARAFVEQTDRLKEVIFGGGR